MSFGFQQAIDFHRCLRYIEEMQDIYQASDYVEYGDVLIRFSNPLGDIEIISVEFCGVESAKGMELVQEYFNE